MESKIPDRNDLANKEINEFRDTKPHQSEDWLRNAYLVEGKEVGEIAKELNISSKLVLIKLNEYNIS